MHTLKTKRMMQCTRHFAGLVLILSTILLASSQPSAQEGPGAASYRYFFPTQVARTSFQEPTRENPDSVAIGALHTSVGVPIHFNNARTLIFPSLQYKYLHIDQNPDGILDALHNPMLKTTALHTFNETWSAIAQVGGGFASDFGGALSREDVVIVAMLIGSYSFSDDFSLGAGVGYDRRTGEVSPLPFLQLDWHFTPTLRLAGVVPARIVFAWRPTDPVSIGILGGIEGERFHLADKAIPADDAELAFSVVSAGPFITAHIGKLLHLRIHAGSTFQRRFELFLDNNSQGEGDLENALFVGGSIRLGLSGWRSDAEALKHAP